MTQHRRPIDHLIAQTFCYAFYPLLTLGGIGWVLLSGPTPWKAGVLPGAICFYLFAMSLVYFVPGETGIEPLNAASSIFWPVTFLKLAYAGAKEILQRFRQYRHPLTIS